MLTRESMMQCLGLRSAWLPGVQLAFEWAKWAAGGQPFSAPDNVPNEMMDAQRAGFGLCDCEADVRFYEWEDSDAPMGKNCKGIS